MAVARPASVRFTGLLAVTRTNRIFHHPVSFGAIGFTSFHRRAIGDVHLSLLGCDESVDGNLSHLDNLSFRGTVPVAPDGSFRAGVSTTIDSYPASIAITGRLVGPDTASGAVSFSEKLPARLRNYCGSAFGFIASGPPVLAGSGPDAWRQSKVRAVVGTLVGTTPGPKSPFFPCTATVVDSDNESVIVAAAHCLETFTGTPLTRFAFAPDHTGPVCPTLACGENPVGVWRATGADAHFDPAFRRNAGLDFGFLRVGLNGVGESLQLAVVLGNRRDPGTGGWVPSLTTAHGLAAALHRRWWSVGYPIVSDSEPPLNDRACMTVSSPSYGNCQYAARRVWCAGVASSHPVGAARLGQLSGCFDYQAGASGGPWFDQSGNVGLLNKAANSSTLLGTPLAAAADRYLAVAGAGISFQPAS
ncbi:serine protease [Conexibacter sp. DBS9H8]|uniref:trypsin-like serine peptidase n=1 Tax=Conexibacter sp. DBS9H8 TaxID=2937801 RepID=UPI00200F1BF7|nr:hypothetical protein [Conexibacter sp. DBS9H8]